jgi:hypothetical protein
MCISLGGKVHFVRFLFIWVARRFYEDVRCVSCMLKMMRNLFTLSPGFQKAPLICYYSQELSAFHIKAHSVSYRFSKHFFFLHHTNKTSQMVREKQTESYSTRISGCFRRNRRKPGKQCVGELDIIQILTRSMVVEGGVGRRARDFLNIPGMTPGLAPGGLRPALNHRMSPMNPLQDQPIPPMYDVIRWVLETCGGNVEEATGSMEIRGIHMTFPNLSFIDQQHSFKPISRKGRVGPGKNYFPRHSGLKPTVNSARGFQSRCGLGH